MPSSGQIVSYGNILLYKTSVFIVKMADHDGNHRCLVEENVPIAHILPCRWQYGAESLRTLPTLFVDFTTSKLAIAVRFSRMSF